MKTRRKCPKCGVWTTSIECCGEYILPPFRMTPTRVKAVRRFAHGRKGLDDATYRMHLCAVGVNSTLELTRDSHHKLMQRLGRLPDKRRNGHGGSQ